MHRFTQQYHDTIRLENLLRAWEEFLRGKRDRRDVAAFQVRLVDNLSVLHRELASKTYTHGPYRAFGISDPKPRLIHKAAVRDRVLHHLLYTTLRPHFERAFVHDSYSCRVGKGTHRAVRRFTQLCRSVSRNSTRTCWVLKCDVRKFFASIDHETLKRILVRCIVEDTDLLWLLGQVIDSFHTDGRPGVGLPLGNLTSQLLVNVYMNEFDQFVKRRLTVRHYVRYADDFIVLSHDRAYLGSLLPSMETFLHAHLKLELNPRKVSIQSLASGVDFLGWVHFPHHRVLRSATKRRMLKRIAGHPEPATFASYLGMLKHGDACKLKKRIEGNYFT